MEFGGNRGHRTSKRVDIIAAQRDSGWLDDARRCALYGIFSVSGAFFWPRIALYLSKPRRSAGVLALRFASQRALLGRMT